MKYKVSISYGSCTFKSETNSFSAEELKHCLVRVNDSYQGYVRVLGKTRVQEHGYSSEENIYGVVTEDYEVKQFGWNDTIEIIKGATFVRTSEDTVVNEHIDGILKTNYQNPLLEVNGWDGFFTYDIAIEVDRQIKEELDDE